MKIYLLSFVLLITAFGCEKNQLTPDQDLAGYWINPQWDNSGLVTYDRADGFVEGYGIAFLRMVPFLKEKMKDGAEPRPSVMAILPEPGKSRKKTS